MVRKLNYPSHRKSPCRHRVSEHKRKGRPVKSYMRGEGDRPASPVRRRLKLTTGGEKRLKMRKQGGTFTVTIRYDTGSETVTVPSKSIETAIDAGLMNRKQIESPIAVTLRRHKS